MSELHGNVFVEKCEKCHTTYQRSYYVMDDYASLYFEELEDNGETDIVKPKHAKQCQLCGLSHRTGRHCEKKGNTPQHLARRNLVWQGLAFSVLTPDFLHYS